MSRLLTVAGLRVEAYDKAGAPVTIVDDINFSAERGEVVALIGESGSGKTTIALALMGYARRGCHIVDGSIRLGELDILSLPSEQLYGIRGNRISYIAQSAAAAFNPSKTIMDQVIETAVIHGLMPSSKAQTNAIELFEALSLPNPGQIGKSYPHQVSGGQLQRLMAAMALISEPDLVILDEPTTALDVTTQIDVLRAFKKVVKDRDTTAVYVSHDLAVVAQMADKIVVLQSGRVQEYGATEQVIHAPKHPYTQELMAAAQPGNRHDDDGLAHDKDAPAPLLEIDDLLVGYGKKDKQGMPRFPVLHRINLKVERGTTLGVIGESGSGKSTLARAISGLLPAARGQIRLNGSTLQPALADRSREELRQVQIVFQNADTALNPKHTVAEVLGRPLKFYHRLAGTALQQRIGQLLEQVQLPAALARRRCVGLSGGQKQRVNLARALAAEPELILCDEVTSALDSVVGAAILDLIEQLRRDLGISFIFISHDISAVRSVCDDVLVLYNGDAVESGPSENFDAPPFHPYTELLIASVPELRRGWLEETNAKTVSDEAMVKLRDTGLCRFLDRCPVRIDGICDTKRPPRVTHANGNEVLCHLVQAES